MTDSWTSLRSATRGLEMILESAQADNKPAPNHARPSKWGDVEFQMESLADLRDWASWRALTIHDTVSADQTSIITYAKGVVYDTRIELYDVSPLLCPCDHPAAAHVWPGGCPAGHNSFAAADQCPCNRTRAAATGDALTAFARAQEKTARAAS